jgi:hypothetical protein
MADGLGRRSLAWGGVIACKYARMAHGFVYEAPADRCMLGGQEIPDQNRQVWRSSFFFRHAK